MKKATYECNLDMGAILLEEAGVPMKYLATSREQLEQLQSIDAVGCRDLAAK